MERRQHHRKVPFKIGKKQHVIFQFHSADKFMLPSCCHRAAVKDYGKKQRNLISLLPPASWYKDHEERWPHALVPGASGPDSSPGWGHCVVFLGKT